MGLHLLLEKELDYATKFMTQGLSHRGGCGHYVRIVDICCTSSVSASNPSS